MDNILVTGGAGFLGMTLVKSLVGFGVRPRVLDINTLGEPDLESSIEFIQGDIRNPDTVHRVVRGMDVVFHLAAAVLPTRGKRAYTSTNTEGTRNLLQASLDHNIRQVVHVSTSAIYGIPRQLPVTEESELRPMGYYGNAKYQGELLVREYRGRGLRVCVLRPRTIIGTERLGIFHILFDWIKEGKRVPIIGKGDNLFQFVSARDCVSACFKAVDAESNDDFNLGAEEFSTVKGDLEGLTAHANTGSRVAPIPAPLVKAPLQVLDLLRLSPLMDWQYKVADKPFYFDITKAKTDLGWEPRDSNLSMFIDSYDWYTNNYVDSVEAYGSTHRQAVRQRFLRLLKGVF